MRQVLIMSYATQTSERKESINAVMAIKSLASLFESAWDSHACKLLTIDESKVNKESYIKSLKEESFKIIERKFSKSFENSEQNISDEVYDLIQIDLYNRIYDEEGALVGLFANLKSDFYKNSVLRMYNRCVSPYYIDEIANTNSRNRLAEHEFLEIFKIILETNDKIALRKINQYFKMYEIFGTFLKRQSDFWEKHNEIFKKYHSIK